MIGRASVGRASRPRASLRPWLAVVGSVVTFGLLIETAGLLPAVLAAVLVAAQGSPDTPVRDALLLGVGLAVGMAILFVVALGQPFPLVRTW